MVLPLADIVGLLQEGVGHLVRETGLALMQTVMEEEVRHLAGDRHQQHEDGYCVVDGQRRCRSAKRGCVRRISGSNAWGSYELFQRSGPMQLGVWDKMMRGLSQVRSGGEGLSQRLWHREVGGERHRRYAV